VGLVAQAAVPAMIVLLGLQLAQVSGLSQIRLVSIGAMLRLLVSPVVAFALVALLHIQGPASIAVIMQASMPVAVVTIIFATEFGLDDRLMSSTILTSTLFSPITLSLLILLLRQQPMIP
jgi:malate permease and related proteins